MRKVLILTYSAFLLIMLANYFYYRNMYDQQISYIIALLDRQVQIVGLEVETINNNFGSDVVEMTLSKDIPGFFDKSKPEIKRQITEQMKTFYSRYKDIVSKIRYYDFNKKEFTLSKDEDRDEWIESEFIPYDQRPAELEGTFIQENNNEFTYYGAVISKSSGKQIGNIAVTVDYRKYFTKLFTEYNLKDYQWQWVITESGEIIYDSYAKPPIRYSELTAISGEIADGSNANRRHEAIVDGKRVELISSYCSSQLLRKDFIGIIFSAPTNFFQKYIIRNSVFIVVGTLVVIQLIILLFWWYIRTQKKKMGRLTDSEKMLGTLIEEMPVGVIIHDNNREILKSNKAAAELYLYREESEMVGKIFPETSLPADSDYFSKHLGGMFRPDQFIIIKKEIGETVLHRSSIPVKYKGEDAILEMLIDVTMLESARKQEAKANVAKSEFLARMSYEIRTPLNGIIGMADVLTRYELSSEIKEVVSLLRRSTEVLLNIINDILDFSKIESGKMILEEVPFNFREELSYSVDLARTNISGKELVIACAIDDKIPEYLIGDPYRLRQILTNLFNHSIANCEQGEIRLKCQLKEKKNGIIILSFEIKDNGKFISKSDLKKLFGDFVGGDSLAKISSEESGFGTIIARQLVELMGGELNAESTAGDRENIVSFKIRTYSNERPQKELDISDIKRFDQIKTLVITGRQNRDEEIMAAIHKTGVASSVTTYQKSTIGQLKTNLSMSDGRYKMIIISDDEEFDGFEVAKALWDNKLALNFIMVMISSNDKKGNYLRSITLGIDHYLVKPFDLSEIFNAVQSSFVYLENSSGSAEMEISKKELRILVVEDNRMNQMIIEKMLRTLGYPCEIAEDGYEGYTRATQSKFDIIFMDLVMPEMDGFESTRRIMEHDKNNLIIAFTADNMPDSKRKAELSGIKDFIAKPVRLEEIKKLFAKYFNI